MTLENGKWCYNCKHSVVITNFDNGGDVVVCRTQTMMDLATEDANHIETTVKACEYWELLEEPRKTVIHLELPPHMRRFYHMIEDWGMAHGCKSKSEAVGMYLDIVIKNMTPEQLEEVARECRRSKSE